MKFTEGRPEARLDGEFAAYRDRPGKFAAIANPNEGHFQPEIWALWVMEHLIGGCDVVVGVWPQWGTPERYPWKNPS